MVLGSKVISQSLVGPLLGTLCDAVTPRNHALYGALIAGSKTREAEVTFQQSSQWSQRFWRQRQAKEECLTRTTEQRYNGDVKRNKNTRSKLYPVSSTMGVLT
ncbi:hypothetical protein ACROYT_G035244 [Oculina patagonica]